MSSLTLPNTTAPPQLTHWVRLSIVLAVLIVAALIGTLISTAEQPLSGIGGDDGRLGGDFSLRGIDGPVSLQDYRGQVVVVYFGFLNCEEVCLNSMRVLQKAMVNLQQPELAQVRVMLISIDPARDRPEDLERFTARFHQNIIGLTGSQQQIEAVARDYGASFRISPADRNEPGYLFRHTSRYYVIDQQGELVDAMRHSTTANEIIARVRQLLDAAGVSS